MNKFVLVIILFLIAFKVNGQKFYFNANMGYGTYALKDIKNFQDDMILSTAVYDEPVESFPNYIYYNFLTDYAFNKSHYTGIGVTYYTTGGRNHVADYSGEYSLDLIAKAYTFDIHYKIAIISYKNFNVFFQYKTGLLFSKLDISENMNVYNSIILDRASEYTGYSIVSEPSLHLSYSIYKSVYLNFSAGFEKCSKIRFLNDKSLESDGEDLFPLVEEDFSADWSGLRTSVGISYSLGKKEKKIH